MLTRRRVGAAQARHRDDDGMTLMELVVAMGVATVVGVMTLAMFLGVNTATTVTTDKDLGTADARSMINRWSTYLAVADSPTIPGTGEHRFEWVTGTEVLFYANLDNRRGSEALSRPTLVWLARREQYLTTELFAPDEDGGYPTQPTSCSVGVHGVDQTDVFTAYGPASATDPTGALSGLGTSLAPATGPADSPCWPLPEVVTQPDAAANAALRTVSSIQISFRVHDRTGKHGEQFGTTVAVGGIA